MRTRFSSSVRRWPRRIRLDSAGSSRRASSGTLVIHVDPRFSRTSALADVWLPIRAGSDIVVLRRTDQLRPHARSRLPRLRRRVHERAMLIREDFKGPEDLDGLFSGWQRGDADSYDTTTWQYESTSDGRPRRDADADSIRARSISIWSATSRATRRRWSRACAASRAIASSTSPIATRRARVRIARRPSATPWADAALGRRADHSRRRDSAAAARQRRTAGRRHARAARPRLDSGIDRHPDAVRPAARLSADARVRARDRRRSPLHRAESHADRLVVELRQVHRQPAEGVVRRRRDARQRLRLRLAAAHLGRSLASGLLARHGRRPDGRACS